jgi:uncharacterized protein
MFARLLPILLLAGGIGFLAKPCTAVPKLATAPIKVLIVDGQNNHKWKETTPVLKEILEKTGLFQVEVATTGEKETAGFTPKFSNYGVVVSNYNGKAWPAETRKAFVDYVENGGGFVSFHAANNAFADWPEYNAMIGVGGWGGRKADNGAYLRINDKGTFTRDEAKGDRAGAHGKQHEFVVNTRVKDHPITQGLPAQWKHTQDELYDRLRGPAKDVTVLASAFADPKQGGSGKEEPMLMVLQYGKGRVFHTTLGHYLEALKGVGFATTFTRGTQWAATGLVTLPPPENFPTAEKATTWK